MVKLIKMDAVQIIERSLLVLKNKKVIVTGAVLELEKRLLNNV